MALATRTFQIYSDFDLNFIVHPLTGDIPKKTNVDSIKQSILNLFFLEKYDVPFNMDAYSNIRRYLFDPLNSITASNIQVRIEWMIKKFEPRIKLQNIEILINQDEDGYDINIRYKIKSLNIEDSITYFFQRVR